MSLLEVDKQLWVGTYGGGISRFDARTRRFENLRPGPEDGLHLSSGRVTALARDRTGHVWIGTDGGGLNVWDIKTRRLYYYKRDAKQLDSLSADTIYSHPGRRRRRRLDRHARRRPRPRAESRRGAAHLRFANYLRSRRACPTTPSTACAPTARATSGSAPTSVWRGSTRRPARSSASIACTACRPRNSTSARTTAIAAASCSSAAPPASTRFYPEVLEFNERPPRVVLTQFLKLNAPGVAGVPEERIERLSARPQGRRDHAQVRGARLRRSARQPLRIQARRLRQRLGARRRAPRRDLHQPARRPLRVPRARQQQRRRVEHAGPGAAHRRGALALALALGLRRATRSWPCSCCSPSGTRSSGASRAPPRSAWSSSSRSATAPTSSRSATANSRTRIVGSRWRATPTRSRASRTAAT